MNESCQWFVNLWNTSLCFNIQKNFGKRKIPSEKFTNDLDEFLNWTKKTYPWLNNNERCESLISLIKLSICQKDEHNTSSKSNNDLLVSL